MQFSAIAADARGSTLAGILPPLLEVLLVVVLCQPVVASGHQLHNDLLPGNRPPGAVLQLGVDVRHHLQKQGQANRYMLPATRSHAICILKQGADMPPVSSAEMIHTDSAAAFCSLLW